MESSTNSKRRRGLGVVTPNACTECRKKRAKCDGETPCTRCTSQGVDCIYEVPVRQSKENMRNEIDILRTHQRQSERILAALVSGETAEEILQQLRGGETLENITERLEKSTIQSATSANETSTFAKISDSQAVSNALRPARSLASSPQSSNAFSETPSSTFHIPRSEADSWPPWGGSNSFQDIPNINPDEIIRWKPEISYLNQQIQNHPLVGIWEHQSRSSSTPDSATLVARGQGQEILMGNTFGTEEQHGYHANFGQSWTNVTSDGAFVEHLMALYFCWEYPTFASLDKEQFLEDFRTGNPRYCSSLLVNALLALGCRFSKQANSRKDPSDCRTAGDHFFAEAMRLLQTQEDRHVLTTIQALGLIAIREASCGRSSESLFFSGQSIRLAIEMGLHLDLKIGEGREAEIEHAVRSATFWGAFSLDQAWSLTIGRLPHFSRDLKLVTKPQIVDHVEAAHWVPYTDEGAPLEKSCAQASNVRSVYKTFCELSEIVHKSLYTLYAPGAHVTNRNLLECYTQHLRWYDAIPTTLRLGHNFTPAVLFSHMYYHYTILLLFRPFIKLSIKGSGVLPRDICSQAADAISALVNSYSKLYTLRRTPSFVPYFVLTSSITHLAILGNTKAGHAKLLQGLADLKEMTKCHGFAIRAIRIIRYLVKQWNVDIVLDDYEEENEEKDRNDRYDDRDILCKPSSTSLNQFCPNIASWGVVNGLGIPKLGDNPVFWPFPMQGRPLLDVGVELENNGFSILAS